MEHNSFLAGLLAGRQIKGWGTGTSGASPGPTQPETESLDPYIGVPRKTEIETAANYVRPYALYNHDTLESFSAVWAYDIGAYAFSGCTKLSLFSVPYASTVGNGAFQGCTSLGSLYIQYASTIGDYAADGCTNLKEIYFPYCITIGDYAFRNCDIQPSLTLPYVNQIGGYAFQNNKNLQKVFLGEGVSSIGVLAFNGCESVTAFVLQGFETPPIITATSLPLSIRTSAGAGYIYCPADKVAALKSATIWSQYAAKIRAIEDHPEIYE